MSLDPRIAAITDRIRERSAKRREAYLQGIDDAASRGPEAKRLSCGNLAHAFAACGDTDKARLAGDATPNLGIVSAYNDMLSAHQPFETYPQAIREHARALGATAQVAGGVPAMCDGVTGTAGHGAVAVPRDVIAQATGRAQPRHVRRRGLPRRMRQDRAGLLIGALAFGHLPVLFVPAGPMTPGIPNKQKAEVRTLRRRPRHARGTAGRRTASYHAPGTVTFYGTANSNQSLLEAMGLQLPGASFVNPGTPLREALTRAAVERALRCTALGDDYRPIGRLIDERAIVNAIAALAATGGSTNHTIHWVAVARAAGIVLTGGHRRDRARCRCSRASIRTAKPT